MAAASLEPVPADALDESGEELDPRAMLTALYREHGAMVYRLATRYGGGDQAWAEDVTQEVFCDLFGHVDRVNRMENPRGWIYRATTSRCLNRLRDDRRRRLRVQRASLADADLASSLEAQGAARHRLTRLFEAVSELPPKERVCFWMFHADGVGVAEIGEIIGHSKGYVSKLLARARAAIAEESNP